MEGVGDTVLYKVLEAGEIETIQTEVRKKLEKFYQSYIGEYYAFKAISETAQKNIETVRNDAASQIATLSAKLQDTDAKYDISQTNIKELRTQLDSSRQEVNKLQENVSRYESEMFECRREKNAAVEERDSLLKQVERRNIEVERLQNDIVALERQLQAASRTKCEALAKVHEIESKEVTLDFKEKLMEQDKQILQHQIQSLTEDLNRSVAELQTIRRDHTLTKIQLETQITEKTEELRINRGSVAHLEETAASLQTKAEELTAKLHSQTEEAAKILNHYKKELQSKTKLVDMMREAKQENEQQINEMSACITELKKLLNESAERYGQLETKLKGIDIEHSKDLEEKDLQVRKLMDELEHANDLLKEAQEESLEHAVEQLAPTAAASSRLIKTGMTLTEIYSLYVKSAEELQVVKKENAQLNLRIRSIIEEIEERAPTIRKQNLDNQKLEEANSELSNQLESLIRDRVEAKEEYDTMSMKLGHMEREYKKLKMSQSDLGIQVCYLVKEIEQMRGGFTSDHDQSICSDMSASEVISKKLVTFSNIQELQENNQKLLHVVRDLSAKLEEIEENEAQKSTASFEAKLASYTKKMEEMQHSQDCQTQMMAICMQQRDRYKKLYSDLSKSLSNTQGLSKSFNFDGSMNGGDQMEEDVEAAASSTVSSEVVAVKERRIAELEEKIKEAQEHIKTIKEEYENYRKEKFTNEKMVNEHFDSMRNEIRDLTATNCKLMSTSANNNEQIKLQQKNAQTLKKQIQTLEEKNKFFEKIIVKHEQTEMLIKDEVMKVQSDLARAEVQLNNLKQENRILKDSEVRMKVEHESLHRERLNQNLLMNNLEMIKASFERSETEGKIRLEERLDQVNRECSALRRRLQEEQDHFRLLSADLERQTETARKRMEDEVGQVDKIRDELRMAREESMIKTKQIEDLSLKLQESLTPNNSDNPIAQATKRCKEMELKASEYVIEIESLQKELIAAKEHVQQYCTLSESAEAELRELSTTYTEFKTQIEAELQKTKLSEESLKAKVEDLETEISLQITKERINDGDSTSQLTRAQTELRDSLQKLSEVQRELRDAREQIRSLTANLQAVEQKYSNEMVARLSDLESMSANKEELNRLREQASDIKEQRDQALDTLKTIKFDWESREKLLQGEIDQLEARMKDHEHQNAALLDQIQALSMKLSVVSAGMDVNMSQNDSAMADSSLLNRSVTEEDIKSSEQLLQIIKYLRKEKDIAFAKVDVLRSETTRLQSETGMLQKKLDETQAALNSERSKPEAGIISASKHEEILRKVETLNAIADSNRILREERDTLQGKVNELVDKVSRIEDELFPIQEKNRELSQKQEEVAAENVSLRIEAVRWRQRANMLVEKTNKTNPEDFKRLQAERENLAKMLTGEKEMLRKVSEELNAIKLEKTRLDSELVNAMRQIAATGDENKKLHDDMLTLRANNQKLANELMEVKNNLLTKEDELKKMSDEVVAKEAQLTDAKNKEIQIRKIAKRYKDSYNELKNKEDLKEGEGSGVNVTDINMQLTSAQEENETLKKENEALKNNREGSTVQLKEATTKLINLQESKNTITKELVVTKTQLQTIEQSRDELQQRVSGYESRIVRMEKEVNDEKENKETIMRLMRENETLALRVNQLQRQLGIQQVAKPSTSASTSEKATNELSRTANVKPMASPSHQSATVTPWRGGETPLASIRPMSVQSRTAAVIPTSQTPPGSNLLSIQGSSSSSSSSSSSATALVPPQQQVHTTGNTSGEVMSSSPTSSHTDYMPTTSSAATVAVVATVPPMGSTTTSSTTAESTQQDGDNSTTIQNVAPAQEISSPQVVLPTAHQSQSPQHTVQAQQQQQPISIGSQQQGGQQAVALVSPRVETVAVVSISVQQSPQVVTDQNNQAAPSTSGGVLPQPVSQHHQASSSNTVTTSQAGMKRPRDVEGDSSTGTVEQQVEKSQPQSKRTRTQVGEVFQGVSESGLEVEYQVPTSSQRESDYDIIVVDSEEDEEEEDNGMADEGTADDGPFEDDADNGESYEMEGYEQEQEMVNYDEGDEGPDIDEDNNVPSDNNEVEVDDSNEIPNQSGNNSNSGAESGPSRGGVQSRSSDQAVDMSTQHQSEIQQIQAISSGSGGNEAGSSTTVATPSSQTMWRQIPHSRQQAAHLVLIQPGYEETGDDCIVPSTPNLFVPRRTDGFSEVISSPHPQVPHGSRFTFNESGSATRSSTSLVPGGNLEGIEDTQIDLSQMNESGNAGNTGRTVPNTPKLVTSPLDVDAGSTSITTAAASTVVGQTQPQQQEPQDLVVHQSPQHQQQSSSQEPVQPGTSSQQSQGESIPEITVTGAMDEDDDEDDIDDDETESDNVEQNAATTSQQAAEKLNHPLVSSDDAEEEGTVTSEGEKHPGTEGVEIDEGREAEASTPSINTRSRSQSNQSPPANRRGQGRGMRSRTPIVWGENRGNNHNNMMMHNRMNQQHQQPSFQQQQQMMMNQRGQRGRRMRGRPGNFRY